MPQHAFVDGDQAVNVSKRLYWSEQLGFGVITNLYDADGIETEDDDDAVSAVVRIHERCWVSLNLSDFERRAPQH